MEINAALPCGETPADTEDYEGFYHLVSMSGDVACAKLHYIVRDHDADKFAARLETLKEISKQMNLKWGFGTVKLTIDEQYRNMAEIIEDGNMHLIEKCKKSLRRCRCDTTDPADPRRYRRRTLKLYGTSMSKPWNRRTWIPRTIRTHYCRRNGQGC